MGNTDNKMYWLWLTTRDEISPESITTLLEYFESPEEIYYTKNFSRFRMLDEKTAQSLSDKSMESAERAAENSGKINTHIITYDDELYPAYLKNIPAPPYVLYILGSMPRFDKLLAIGVVGTRNTTEYGRTVTSRLCTDLARAGALTVGGLARGIDSVGAWATLDAGGTAVGVIGCGLDIVYPRENGELMKAITEKGCVISEYPPGSPPLRQHFPARNRIIAGISRGVLVTEAPQRSGALITVRCALDSGRDVFAVPRPITDTEYLGANIIIQQGAKLVNCAEDIICEYPYAKRLSVTVPEKRHGRYGQPEKVSKAKVKIAEPKPVGKEIDKEKYDKLNGREKDIINTLKNKNMQVDELTRALSIASGELNTALLMLEIKGLVKKLPGNVYQLKI